MDPKPVGFWVKLVDQLIDGVFASTLEEHGVTRRQWHILSILSRSAVTVLELEVELGPFRASDPQESVAEQVAELVESEWVVEGPDARLDLTELGASAAERLAGVIDGVRTSVTAGLTAEEYESTIAVLERVARNLGWSDTPTAG